MATYNITSGQTSTNLIISTDEYFYVFNGGTAINTKDWGRGIVSSGGLATLTTVSGGGSLTVSSAGTATKTTVNGGGNLYVASAGTATETTVNDHGSVFVSPTGKANDITVNQGGWLNISNGGTATAITEHGGFVNVLSFASVTFVSHTFTGLTLTYQGATVHSGTTAHATTLDVGGNMIVSSGGTASSTTVNSSGYLYVSSAGTATETTVNSRGSMYVSGAGSADKTTLNSGGSMTVSHAGKATLTTVNSGGSMIVISSGSADKTTVNQGGYMTVYSAGTATAVTENGGYVNDPSGANVIYVSHTFTGLTLTGQSATVHSVTKASDTILNRAGKLYVYTGGSAVATTVNDSGYFTVYSGGTATETTVNSGGSIYVLNAASASAATVNSGGLILISSGGSVYDLTLSAGGRLGGFSWNEDRYWASIENGSAIVADNVSVIAMIMHVSSGGTANRTENIAGSMYVSSGGVANETVLSALMTVCTGGTANATTVNRNGWLSISSGGAANETTVNINGRIHVSSGGAANETTVNSGGRLIVYSSGAVNETTVNSGGSLFVSSSGKVTGALTIETGAVVTVSAGGILDFDISALEPGNAALVNNLALITGTPSYTITVSETQGVGAYTLAEGASSFDQTVTVNTDTGTTLGTITVGGILNAGGHGYILTENSGTLALDVWNGMVVSGLVLIDSTYTAGSGVNALDTVVSSGGYLYVSGGFAEATAVNSSGNLYVVESGTATSTTVNSGGFMDIYLGGSATETVVNSSGNLNVANAGTINSTTVNGGVLVVGNGGTATSTTVNSGGRITVYLLGDAYELTLSAGGLLGAFSWNEDRYVASFENGSAVIAENVVVCDSRMYVYSGGVANATTVNWLDNYTYAYMHVRSGGVANSTTVNSLGYMRVYEGGVANSVTVNSGGTMRISSGGKVTGKMTFADGAVVSAYEGGIVDFDISALSPDNAALVNNLSLITGTPAYTITVSETQSVGTYTLAEGVTGFDQTITVNTDTGTTLGTVTVDGGLFAGGYYYRLAESAGALTFTADNAGVIFVSGTYVSSAMTMSAVPVDNGGAMYVLDLGTAESILVSSGGVMRVYSGGTANSATVTYDGSMYVYAGGTANSAAVTSFGQMYVYSGGVANATTVNWPDNYTSAYMHVRSGGVANSTTLNWGGFLYVSSGGMATATTLNRYCHMEVFSSGAATSTTVNSLGYIYVFSSGTATSTTVNSAGFMYVSSGGVLNETTLNYQGWMVVRDGGAAVSVMVNGGGGYIFSGGMAAAVTVDSDGFLRIYDGGLASDTVVYAGGSMMIVSSGGRHTGFLTIAEGATVTVSSGGVIDFDISALSPDNAALVNNLALVGGNPSYTITVSATQTVGTYTLAEGASSFDQTVTVFTDLGAELGTITVGGELANGDYRYALAEDSGTLSLAVTQYIEDLDITGSSYTAGSGVTLEDATVNSGGELYVSGAVASDTTVTSDGVVYVSAGGITTSTTINSGGAEHVLDGGSALVTVVSSGGELHISSGGYASGTTDMGDVFVSSGGVAETTVISSGGEMHVYTSGLASDTTVGSDGALYLSGGTASDTTVLSGGEAHVLENGSALVTVVSAGGELHISSGGYASGTTDLGDVYVSSGGVAETTVISSGGEMHVYTSGLASDATVGSDGTLYLSGGTASDTTILDGGAGHVLDGGSALATVVSSGGELHISSGGYASGTTDMGDVFVSSGGVAETTVISSGGEMHVYTNGLASDTTVGSDGTLYLSGGTASDTTILDGGAGHVLDGGSALATVVSAGGELHISSGGYASGTTDMGDVFVSSGGVAETTVISSGGEMHVYTSGLTSDTTVMSSGGLFVLGGSANETTVDSWGSMFVSGGAATSTVVNANGELVVSEGSITSTTVNDNGSAFVYDGGSAVDNVLYGNMILSGGVAVSTVISGGKLHVFDSGLASETEIRSDGYMYVYSGGSAADTVVYEGGNAWVLSGGTVTSTVVSSGGMIAVNGGAATSTVVESRGSMYVYGGTASETVIESKGSVTVESGSVISTVVSSGGSMIVKDSGTAISTFIESRGAVTVSSGGLADDTFVSSGGSLTVSDGGKVTGTLDITSGAVVTFQSGAVFDFDISPLSPGNAALVSGLSLIQGDPSYTVTVSDTQELGEYTLADGAATFDKTVTVVTDTGTTIGTITVGGEIQNGDVWYSLDVGATGDLIFTVTDNILISLSISIDDASFTYNGADQYATANTAVGLAAGDYVDSVTVAGVRDAGTYTVTATAATIRNAAGDDVTANYDITFLERANNITVDARNITVTAGAETKLYGNADPALIYTVDGLVAGDTLTGSLTRAAGENVGTYAIGQGTLDGGANYNIIDYTGANFTITARPLSLFIEDATFTYNGQDQYATVSNVSGLAAGDRIGSITVDPVHDAGSYSVTASAVTILNGNDDDVTANYHITIVPGDVTVNAKNITVTAGAETKLYGNADPALIYTVDGLVAGDTLTGSLTRAAGENVGTYAIGQGTLDGGANYNIIDYTGANFTITARPLSLFIEDATFTYNGQDQYATVSNVSGLAAGDRIGSITVDPVHDAGSYSVTASAVTILNGNDDDVTANYHITIVPGDVTVNAKNITVTAEAQTKVYGDADPELTYTVDGLVAGDTLTGSLTRAAGENVGAYAIGQGTLDGGANYTIDYTGADFTITPRALSLSINDASFTYNGADQYATAYTVAGLATGDYVDSVTVDAVHDAGIYSITATAVVIRNAADEDVTANYDITFVPGVDNVTVNRKNITVTADDQMKYVGDPDPEFTYTVDGLVDGDTLSGALTRESGEERGAYAITQGTLDAGSNYIINYTGAKLSIYWLIRDMVLTDSSFTVDDFTITERTVINHGGELYVSGGLATSTTVNSDGLMRVSDGGRASETTVNAGGDLVIADGGRASGAVVNSGGGFFATSGGSAGGIVVSEGGRMDITVAPDTCLNGTSGGSAFEMANGVLSGYCLTDYNFLVIESGGTAISATIDSGTMIVGVGGSAAFAEVRYGNMLVSGGAADSTSVGGSGFLAIRGGAVSNTVVDSGGSVFVSGGTATALVVSEGGECEFSIVPGGVIEGESAGRTFVFSGGMLSGVTIGGMDVVVSSGIAAVSTAVVSGGRLQIDSGATAADTVLESGFLNVMNGGVASDTAVSGGGLWVHDGGVAENITVEENGNFGILSGGTATGTMRFGSGAAISAYDGSVIDFNITVLSPENAAIVNDLALIGGTPGYTVTVSDTQTFGAYTLAAGAADFDGVLTVTADIGTTLGTVGIGTELSAGGRTYSLAVTGSELTLTIAAAAPASPRTRGDINGNGTSDLLFQNLADPMNPLGAWMDADMWQWNGALGPAPTDEWTVYGAFDFTGDGVCDIMFRNKLADTGYAVGFYDMGEGGVFKTMGFGVSAEWDLAGVGDFNGNGVADILWRNRDNGYHGLWLDGTDEWTSLPYSYLGQSQKIYGTGDANNDGRDEILIDSNGVIGAWDISGVLAGTDTAPVWSEFGLPAITPDWEIVGGADFDGNGTADVLLWNDNGFVGTYMNCDPYDFRCVFANAGKSDWGIPGFGDYDGDGCEDILVRNAVTGALGCWSGGDGFAWKAIGFGVDNSWAVIA